jgi:hypothetical protein
MQIELRLGAGRTLRLDDGVLAPFRARLRMTPELRPTRLAYAATRIVLREDYARAQHSLERPGTSDELAAAIDWPATANLRRGLDAQGFGIAEAMDTAQRFQIGWSVARRLIETCGELKLRNGFVAGAGVDHLAKVHNEDELIAGVVHQARTIQAAGGEVILLPLVWLNENRCDEDGYVRIYTQIVRQLDGPLYVHWLGEMFLPALAGYFPGNSFSRILAFDAAKIRGAKLSLLDAKLEVRWRRELLARDQILLSGDDFNFAGLILGGASGDPAQVPAVLRHTRVGSREVALGDFSHALLGVLDAVAGPAALALRFLACGDGETYMQLMRPCEELGRWLFQPPTQHYKAGLAFLSWLDGRQDNAMLANHEERRRDREHYLRAAELASAAGVLRDAVLAEKRLAAFLS